MQRPARLTLIVLLTAILILLAGVAAWLVANGPAGTSSAGSGQGRALVGGPFTLTDQNGRPFTEADLEGSLTLIFFGYTYCPDICPLTLQSVATALDDLGADAGRVMPVFVTVDPERDTPERLKEYVAWFDPRIVGLTGTREQVEGIKAAYRVYGQKVEDPERGPDDYLVDHSAVIYLMGPDGAFIRHFSHTTPPDEIAAGLREALS